MARKSSAANVKAEITPPDYRGAVTLLRTIEGKKSKVGEMNGEIGGVYDRVDNMRIPKKASRIFLTLDKMEPDERTRIVQALYGCMDAAVAIGSNGWAEEQDLVDKAQDNVVQMSGRKAKESPETPQGEEEANDFVKKNRAKAPGFKEALGAARAHLGGTDDEKIPGDDPLEEGK